MALSEDNCSSECQLSQTLLLCLFDLQAADEGEYQCVAESEAGAAERTINLKVQSELYLYSQTLKQDMKLSPHLHLLMLFVKCLGIFQCLLFL